MTTIFNNLMDFQISLGDLECIKNIKIKRELKGGGVGNKVPTSFVNNRQNVGEKQEGKNTMEALYEILGLKENYLSGIDEVNKALFILAFYLKNDGGQSEFSAKALEEDLKQLETTGYKELKSLMVSSGTIVDDKSAYRIIEIIYQMFNRHHKNIEVVLSENKLLAVILDEDIKKRKALAVTFKYLDKPDEGVRTIENANKLFCSLVEFHIKQ